MTHPVSDVTDYLVQPTKYQNYQVILVPVLTQQVPEVNDYFSTNNSQPNNTSTRLF